MLLTLPGHDERKEIGWWIVGLMGLAFWLAGLGRGLVGQTGAPEKATLNSPIEHRLPTPTTNHPQYHFAISLNSKHLDLGLSSTVHPLSLNPQRAGLDR